MLTGRDLSLRNQRFFLTCGLGRFHPDFSGIVFRGFGTPWGNVFVWHETVFLTTTGAVTEPKVLQDPIVPPLEDA
jgi:hypothetical protein